MSSITQEKEEENVSNPNHSSSLLEIIDPKKDTNDEAYNTTLEDLFSSDMLPWDKISETLPTSVTCKLRTICGVINWFIYLVMIVVNPLTIVVRIAVSLSLWKKAYTETQCRKYFSFDAKYFTHHVIFKNTTNNETSGIECDNSPMNFLGHLTLFYFVPMCIYLAWFYLNDHRYGVMKLIAEKTGLRCRKMNWMYQTAIIIALIPFNFFLSIIAYLGAILMVNIPVIEWLVLSPKFHVCPKTNDGKKLPRKVLNKYFSDKQLIVVYLLYSVTATYVEMTLIMFSFVRIYVIVFSIFFANREMFREVFEMLCQVVFFLLSFVTPLDVILDIYQTIKYKRLTFDCIKDKNGRLFSVSSNYFVVSVLSLIFPVLLSYLLIIKKRRKNKVVYFITPQKDDTKTKFKRLLSALLKTFIEYLMDIALSILFCYFLVACVLLKHGIQTFRKGRDDERCVDIDPFHLIAYATGSKHTGLLDLYGLENFKTKSLPLLGGIEQIGEATIQTLSTFIFIMNHHNDMPELTSFLGVYFETSALSFAISFVSLCIGLFRFFNMTCKSLKNIQDRCFQYLI